MDTIFLGSQNPFREQIVYTAQGAAAKTIWAHVLRHETIPARDRGTLLATYKNAVYVSRTDVPTVKVQADQVTLTKNSVSQIYRVTGVLYEDEACFKLGLK